MDTEKNFILKAENIVVNRSAGPVLNDISFVLQSKDHLAIIGESGSGKTILGLAISGRIFYKGEIEFSANIDKIVWIEQQHHFRNRYNISDLYYQQRFNSYDSEQTQTVGESLSEFNEGIQEVLQFMKIEHLRNKPLIQLSNGENKKLQIARALLSQPSVLIMDQPFIGLDKETRSFLCDLLNKLANQGILIILITSSDEMPGCITKVLCLENGKIKFMLDRNDFIGIYSVQKKELNNCTINKPKLAKFISDSPSHDFNAAIEMKNVNVQYGEKKILEQINWEVLKGERWLLSGANGAGKSTLLSLVTADNPQAYANEICLFDRRRGTGESIWDIKKKIGYLSPELHLFFDQSSTCFETVASGLFDTIGLFRILSDNDNESVHEWMAIMGIGKLLNKRLYELSVGEQRSVLLARALVKNPPLLILDEPFQGVDKAKQSELIDLINIICLWGNKTMVFVTHYENEKPDCIDHFLKLDNGKVIGKGILT